MRWLGAGAATSASLLWSGCGDGGPSDSASPERVIIIGAGIAGLTLGNALAAAGIESVVLEARDRIGGRIDSRDVGGVPVDLGGMWISGPVGNPATCVIREEGLDWRAAEPLDVTTRGYDAVLGQSVDLGALLEAATAIDGFYDSVAGIARNLGPNATAADALAVFLDQAGLTGTERRYAEFALRVEFEINTAQSPELVALSDNPSRALPGGEHFPEGSYRGMVNALGRGVDVRLDTVVSRVAYDDDGVTVETSSGVERGSHVVVTVPLGVLKAGAITFSPELPEAKRGAISRLDMGELEKVVLRYDEAFWPDPGTGNFLYLSEQPGEFPLIVDYTGFAEGAPTLVGFYCGNYGREVSAMPDEDISGRLAEIVEEIAGAPGPTPTDIHVTRWKSDPFALGSYIYLPVGATSADIQTLAEPVGERVLFAGEATSLDYNGYVHGAILSGIREAERLLGRQGQGVALESGLVVSLGCDEEA
ncbi:MAG: NAD(P)/FAD-dependent oxidoreductase [Myxococcota bacterium]